MTSAPSSISGIMPSYPEKATPLASKALSSSSRLRGLYRSASGCDFQFLNVPAVGIDFDLRQHAPAFVIIPMGEFITGGEGLHAEFRKEFLIMMGAGAAYEQHGPFAFRARADRPAAAFSTSGSSAAITASTRAINFSFSK